MTREALPDRTQTMYKKETTNLLVKELEVVNSNLRASRIVILEDQMPMAAAASRQGVQKQHRCTGTHGISI